MADRYDDIMAGHYDDANSYFSNFVLTKHL